MKTPCALPHSRQVLGLLALAGLLLAACSSTSSDVPSPASSAPAASSPIERLDVAVGEDPLQRIDIFSPPAATNAAAGPFPAVLHIHGGGWTKGDKSMLTNASRRLAREQGYVVVAVNYRLAKFRSKKNVWPACWDDVRAALEWVEKHAEEYRVDPSRIAAVGYSAGGHLSALLGTRPETRDKIVCVVDFFGPADLRPPAKQRGRKLLMGTSKRDDAVYAAASPLLQAGPDSAPFLMLHGEDDRLVPIAQSEALCERLKEHGVAAELHTYPRQKHAFNRPDEDGTHSPEGQDAMERAYAFLAKHLKGE